jgi:hypothetical protein
MIRNVVMCKLKPGADDAVVGALLPRFAALDCPGTLSYTIGRDLGLKEGGWSFAIVSDHADADAYHRYDLDAEHNHLREELAPLAEQVARVQFDVPGTGPQPDSS